MVLVNVIISSRQLNQSVFFSTIGRIGLDCSNCWGIWNPSRYPAFDFWLQRGPVCWFWVDNVYFSTMHLLCYQSFYPPIFRRGSKILRPPFRGEVIKSSFWKGGLPLGGQQLTFVLRWEKKFAKWQKFSVLCAKFSLSLYLTLASVPCYHIIFVFFHLITVSNEWCFLSMVCMLNKLSCIVLKWCLQCI